MYQQEENIENAGRREKKKRSLFSFFRKSEDSTRQNLKSLKAELQNDFAPIVERTKKSTIEPLKERMRANPKATVGIMMLIVIINALLLIFFTDTYSGNQENAGYSKLISGATKDVSSASTQSPLQAAVSPKNIRSAYSDYKQNLQAIEAMQDSLSLLMMKRKLTREDSLAFIRIAEFLQQIQKTNL